MREGRLAIPRLYITSVVANAHTHTTCLLSTCMCHSMQCAAMPYLTHNRVHGTLINSLRSCAPGQLPVQPRPWSRYGEMLVQLELAMHRNMASLGWNCSRRCGLMVAVGRACG